MSDQSPYTSPAPAQPNQPAPPAGAPYAPPNQDVEHLKLLSIFHYIMGALTALGGCFFLLYVIIGIGVGVGVSQSPDVSPSDAQEAQMMGTIFSVVGGIGTILCFVIGLLIILSGRALHKRKSRTFSYIIAGLLCINMPLGTALGVFTFIVLGRDSVRQLYDEAARA